MLQLYGIEHKVYNSKFERNELGSVGLIFAHSDVTLTDSYVVHQYFNFERVETGIPYYSYAIYGEALRVPTFEEYISDFVDPSEIRRALRFKQTYFEHSMRDRRDESTIIGFYGLDSDSPIIEFKRFEEGLNTLDCYWDGRTLCR